jgi:hypothetical protein
MGGGKTDVSHISNEQMKEIMKAAVDSVYRYSGKGSMTQNDGGGI